MIKKNLIKPKYKNPIKRHKGQTPNPTERVDPSHRGKKLGWAKSRLEEWVESGNTGFHAHEIRGWLEIKAELSEGRDVLIGPSEISTAWDDG
jgi:hypothetical protein